MWPAIVLASVVLVSASPSQDGLLLTGSEAEIFLREAKIEGSEDIGIGVTKPQRLTLSDGTTTSPAAWKTVDIFKRGLTRVDGKVARDFRDSYKFEIAAYELDKLLGLGFVPPAVERTIRGETGSLSLWVHGTVTEWDRQQENIPIKSPKGYVEGMLNLRLFHLLTHNIDYKNVRNVLVGDGKIWAIDHSRAFRNSKKLIEEIKPQRFSRSVLEALRGLTMEVLQEPLGKWLAKRQLEAMLARRDLIVEGADKLIAERGEEAVLFD
ncbi:MAG: hypothetical protein E2P02_07100 [Acidobacteria bacterium]|nr:MAG: hypothetical protein E2P02_07100 [Acidobacteriota bacterium]